MTDNPDDPEIKKIVQMFINGYFAGFEEGIKQVASILKNAKERGCQIPDEFANVFVAVGALLEQRANKMTHEEAAAIREDNEDAG